MQAEDAATALSDLVRLGCRLIVQEALEAEQTAFIGRDHYASRIGQRLSHGL